MNTSKRYIIKLDVQIIKSIIPSFEILVREDKYFNNLWHTYWLLTGAYFVYFCVDFVGELQYFLHNKHYYTS